MPVEYSRSEFIRELNIEFGTMRTLLVDEFGSHKYVEGQRKYVCG